MFNWIEGSRPYFTMPRAVAQILADAAEARVAQPVLAKTTPNTAARPKGGPEVGMVAAE